MRVVDNMNEKRELFQHMPLYYSIPLLAVCIFVLLILIFLFRIETPVFLQPVPAGAINVSSCGVLSQDNGYYVLNQSFRLTSDPCIFINASNVVLDGQSKYIISAPSTPDVYIAINITGNNVTIKGVNISGAGLGSVHTGVLSIGNNTKLSGNYFNGVYFWAINMRKNYANVIERNLMHNSSGGIYIENSFNNYIDSNLYKGLSFEAKPFTTYGVQLYQSDYNIILNNTFERADYTLLGSTSNYNALVNDRFIDSFESGIEFSDSHSNILFNGLVSSSRRNGIAITTPFIFQSNSMLGGFVAVDSKVIMGNRSHFDFYFRNPAFFSGVANFSANLINTSFDSYSLSYPFMVFSNNFGELKFNIPLNLTGTNFTSDVRIRNNSVFVNSSLRPGLNKTTTVNLFDIPTGYTNVSILRDGAICSPNICSNLSYHIVTLINSSGNPYQVSAFEFNVTSWSNYSINYSFSSTPGMAQTISIEEPDADERYTTASFPVTFNVVINMNGTVRFSLNNGSTNTTMVTTDNRTFNYVQNTLSIGNYVFTAYANFSNGTRMSSFVKFSVVNSTGSSSNGGSNSGGSNSGGSPGSSAPGGTPGGAATGSTGGTTTTAGGTSGGTTGTSGESNSALRNTIYWLIVSITSIMIIILAVLIWKAFHERKFKGSLSTFNISKPAGNQLVSNLR